MAGSKPKHTEPVLGVNPVWLAGDTRTIRLELGDLVLMLVEQMLDLLLVDLRGRETPVNNMREETGATTISRSSSEEAVSVP